MSKLAAIAHEALKTAAKPKSADAALTAVRTAMR
jgi:hypothetical protein